MGALEQRIASTLALPERGVASVVRLLDDGATVPFIARYRKEATGGLDEVQIRDVAERGAYLRDLDSRRETILRSIDEQGKLTDDLARRLQVCSTKSELEDLYLPFRPKRKTRASVARERGLEPLALRILAQPDQGNPASDARRFVDPAKEVPDVESALAGASDIVVEIVSERADVRTVVREALAQQGVLTSRGVKERTTGRTKFEDYYDYREPIRRVASHRYLALCRGEAEGVLRVKIRVEEERLLGRIERMAAARSRSAYFELLRGAVREAFRRRVLPALEKEARADLAARSEREAVDVFANNLKDLLLAAPYGGRPLVAVDPGLRTGSKCVVLDRSGNVLEHVTIYPERAAADRHKAESTLAALLGRRSVDAVAVGNGTGGRETERFVRELLSREQIDLPVVSVSEAGASVYSASDLARAELGDLDVTVRGAVSIGRRMQDPLAELVKIDPASIGVGQYQHDVDQTLLARKLGQVVESCVNGVGVELNTASAALLSRVAGVGPRLAEAIVTHRTEAGGFRARRELLDVKGLGPRAFEQCAGFLRVRGGSEPLDASAVHPERYGLVGRMARDLGVELQTLVGSAEAAGRIEIGAYVGDGVGEPTLRDIVGELAKPGRDPRETFEAPRFRDDLREIEDLEEGMVLEGVVTNVAAFGAFVDVGVHQDGLVHVSQLADRFVDDPRSEVKVGDRVRVRVLGVDVARRRISLGRKGVS